MKLVFLLLCFWASALIGQTDSLVVQQVDSTSAEASDLKVKFLSKAYFTKVFGKENYPNPKVAGVLSLIVPGAGQFYNKKYWKIPVVYAGLGALAYGIDFNRRTYQKFRDSYEARIDDDPNTVGEFPFLSEGAVLSNRNKFNKQRQQVWLGFFAVWILNSTEAFINAHLMKFDVSDDLTLQITPYLNPSDIAVSGVSFTLSLR